MSEGLPHRRIYLTGSPMKEILNVYSSNISESEILKKINLKANNYFLVSVHRQENVDSKHSLKKIISTLNSLAEEYNLPVIVSTHPRTKNRLNLLDKTKFNKLIVFLKPFGFFDYVKLQQDSKCVLSDSGTISEESSILNFPAISLRNSMERPEAQDTGSIILAGLDSSTVLNAVKATISCHSNDNSIPFEYGISDTSIRVLKLILGNTKLSNKWWGIN